MLIRVHRDGRVVDRTKKKNLEKKRFLAYGIPAQRVPLSGGTSYAKGDVEAEIAGRKWRIESKIRATGFKQLYSWLAGNDALIVRADRQEALVVMPLRTFCELMGEGDIGEQSGVRTQGIL